MFFLLFKLIRKVIYAILTLFFGLTFIQFLNFQLDNTEYSIYYVLILFAVATVLGLRFLLHRKRKIPYFKRTLGYLSILVTLYITYTWLLSGEHYPTIQSLVVHEFQLNLLIKTLDFDYSFYEDFNQAIKVPSITILLVNIVLPFIRERRKNK